MFPEKIILFDGVCNLCNGLVKFIIKHDRRKKMMFAALQSSFGQEFLNSHNLDPDDRNSVIYISGDHFYSRSTAILNILRDIGSGWRLICGFRIIPVIIRDAIYDLIAKHRYKIFGRRESCMVPTLELKERFLEEA